MPTTSALPASYICPDISLVSTFFLIPITQSYPLTFLTGKPNNFRSVASSLGIPVLGEIPLVEGVSAASDAGRSYVLSSDGGDGDGGLRWRDGMAEIAEKVDMALFGHEDGEFSTAND